MSKGDERCLRVYNQDKGEYHMHFVLVINIRKEREYKLNEIESAVLPGNSICFRRRWRTTNAEAEMDKMFRLFGYIDFIFSFNFRI